MNLQFFIPILIGVISFIGKSIWDIYNANRNRKIDFLEKQLSLFYYPVLIRLEKDNVIWELILDKRKGDGSLKEKIGSNIEKNIILPNHSEIIDIIEKNTYLCQDEEIIDLLVKYIKHISIYNAIRESGDQTTFPMNYDKEYEWPKLFYSMIAKKTKKLQIKLDSLTWQ